VNVWTTVHADHFTDNNVGRYRETPRFKADYGKRAAVRHSPDRRYVERFEGKRIFTTSVQVERTKVSGHEVRHVKLPLEQKRVVEQHKVTTYKSSHKANKANQPDRSKRSYEKEKKFKKSKGSSRESGRESR
jgi:hypothetical protein